MDVRVIVGVSVGVVFLAGGLVGLLELLQAVGKRTKIVNPKNI